MEITFEQIAQANRTLKLTPVRGKDYVEVNQRVKGFRQVYPTGWITTNIEREVDGLVIIKARCGYKDEKTGQMIVLAEGTAFEERTSSPINRTSYIENCETSAVGRCLGFAGFGIDTAVCSADEMNGVIEIEKDQMRDDGYDPDAKVKPETAKFIVNVMPADRLKKMLDHYGVQTVAELTTSQAGEVLQILKVKDPNSKGGE